MRRAAVGVAVAALLLLAGGSAGAIGTAGVEIVPLLDTDASGGRVLVAGAPPAGLLLRNTTTSPVTVRIYGASATAGPDGVAVGGAGSAPWLHLDAAELELSGGEERQLDTWVDAGDVAPDTAGAFVLEVQNSRTLITRAASVFTVVAGGPGDPRAALLAAASALTLLLAAGHFALRRSRAAAAHAALLP